MMDSLNTIVTTLLLFMIVYLLHKLSIRNFDHWRKRRIPYIEPVAFVGNLKNVVTFKTNIGLSIADMYRRMKGPMFGIWCFNTPFLVARSPELVKSVLNQDFSHFHNRAAGVDKSVDPISSNILFMLRNPDWKNVRQKTTPAFSSAKIKVMMPLLDEVVLDMISYLRKNCCDILDAREVCAKYSTDVITSCAFGFKGNSFVVENAPFRDAGRQMFGRSTANGIRTITYFLLPKLASLFRIRFVPPVISTLFQSAFWQAVQERESSNLRRNDLIDILRKLKEDTSDGIIMDDNMMVGQAVMFFIAGFETSSATISYALYELSLNKSLQDVLRTEVKTFLSKHRSFSYSVITEMPYLHKIVSETLRKYPVLPFLDRRCMKQFQVPHTDLVIEEGTPVLIPVYGLHHDAEIYAEPEKFDPERFSQENVRRIPAGAYIPFGIGPRACAGERFGLIMTKLGLAEIIAKFEVEITHDTPVPLVFDTKSLTLSPEKGLPLRFIKHG